MAIPRAAQVFSHMQIVQHSDMRLAPLHAAQTAKRQSLPLCRSQGQTCAPVYN